MLVEETSELKTVPGQGTILWDESVNGPLGLWTMGNGFSYYPYTNGAIAESFGRGSASFTLYTSPNGTTLSLPHLYNVMSKANDWASRLNNVVNFSTNLNSVGFYETSPPRLGWGNDESYFRGYMAELMIFDRELTAGERDIIATNYFQKRFNLW